MHEHTRDRYSGAVDNHVLVHQSTSSVCVCVAPARVRGMRTRSTSRCNPRTKLRRLWGESAAGVRERREPLAAQIAVACRWRRSAHGVAGAQGEDMVMEALRRRRCTSTRTVSRGQHSAHLRLGSPMNSGCKSSQDFSPPWCARDRLQHAALQLHGAAQLRRQLPRVHTCAPAAATGRPAASAGSSASAARARAPGPSTASAAPTARRRGAEPALPSAAHKAGRARGQGRAGEPRRRRRHRGCPPRPAACLVEAVPAQAQITRRGAVPPHPTPPWSQFVSPELRDDVANGPF